MDLVSNEEGRNEKFPVGMRVLAVDDNPICLRQLEELLLHCKYHVTKTMESKKALEMLRDKSNKFDLVISDVEMPDTDGFKLLEICLEKDLPVIMLSAHSDYESVMKGIIHGACDYLIKPVNIKEIRNIWQHVVKKNIKSFQNNIEPSRNLPPPSESNLAPSVSRKRKEKVNSSGEEDDSDSREEDGEGSEQDGDESSSRKKPRVVWSQELHQKFVNAVQQLGLDKAVPKKILDYMHIDGLTRENVASHLQKYRLYLKKLDEGQHQNMNQLGDASYFQMAQLDGLGDFNTTRQLQPSSLLTRSHFPTLQPSINQGMNSSSFIQQGHHHPNTSNSANPFGTYHNTLVPRVQNVNLFQRLSSSIEPLQFSRSNSSGFIGDFKSRGDRAIGGSFLDSRMPFASSSTSLPNPSSNIANYTQPLPRASDGTQSCLDGNPSNSCFPNITMNGLSRFPGNSWQGNLKTSTFPPHSAPPNPAFTRDHQVAYTGNGLGDCTSLVSAENHAGQIECEPQLLGDFMTNMNTFGNVEYPLPEDNMVFRNKGMDGSVMNATENSTTLNRNPENALVENQKDVFDDIMNEMIEPDENNGMVSMAATFGFDSFPPT